MKKVSIIFLTPSFLVGLLIALPALSAELGFDEKSNTARALLVPFSKATVSAQITGQIKEITVDIGNRFKKDDILVEFDCRLNNAKLSRANAELNGFSKNYASYRKLAKFSSVSKVELSTAKANVERAQADVSAAQTEVSGCTIKAPFDGRVVQRKAQPHETIRTGDAVLDLLADKNLKMRILVPSKWLKDLRIGTAFEVNIDETLRKYQAKVSSIGAEIDPVSQSIEIIGIITGTHPELIAGMSGTAKFDFGFASKAVPSSTKDAKKKPKA